jgi:hypothetical protein
MVCQDHEANRPKGLKYCSGRVNEHRAAAHRYTLHRIPLARCELAASRQPRTAQISGDRR